MINMFNHTRDIAEEINSLLNLEANNITEALENAGAEPVKLSIGVKFTPTDDSGYKVETTLTFVKEKVKGNSLMFIDDKQQNMFDKAAAAAHVAEITYPKADDAV